MKMNSLQDIYIEELRDLYDAENQIVKALPKMVEAANNEELQNAFTEHLEQTKEQIQRLEKIFEDAGLKAKGKKCEGIKGIIAEGQEWLDQELDAELMDVALIASAQRIEHYEIAAYGCVSAYAKALEREDEADQLEQTLDEEKDADEKLTELSETINLEAAKIGAGEEEESEEELQETKPKKSH
jgi:ferritin-like metal-binding protein YciE